MIVNKIMCISLLFMSCINGNGQTPSEPKIEVKNTIALLGTYHFSNPNQDQFNVKSDNVFSEKRQQEIEQLTQMLADYKPTIIALEFNVRDTALNAKYHKYLKGEHNLNSDEIEQIGFRLAKMVGHEHIFPIDENDIRLDFDPGSLAVEYGTFLENLQQEGSTIMSQIQQWQDNLTIGETLANLNAPQLDVANLNLYYQYILPIGKNENQPGVEALTRWYKRNLFIFHHIIKLVEGKQNQRILIIFGQGHTAMLNQFLKYSTIFEVEEIAKYLPNVKK